MGRKTFESIGRPLPNRFNIVITKDFEKLNQIKRVNQVNLKEHTEGELFQNLIFVQNIEEAEKKAFSFSKDEEKIGIIGGANIYKEFLEKKAIKKIYLTILDKNIDNADVFFCHEFLQDFIETESVEKFDEKEGNIIFKNFSL